MGRCLPLPGTCPPMSGSLVSQGGPGAGPRPLGVEWSPQSGSLPARPNRGFCELDRTLGPLVPIPSFSEEESKTHREKSFTGLFPNFVSRR